MSNKVHSSSSASQDVSYAHIEKFLSSGMSCKDYIKQQNLSAGSFYYWKRKYLACLKVSGNFQKIHITEQELFLNGSLALRLPSGIEIVCQAGSSISDLKLLLGL